MGHRPKEPEMKRCAFLAVLASVLFAATAFAGNQQLGSTYFPLTNQQTYNRFDGIAASKTTKIPVLIGNGDGFQAIGPQYRETFAYGDGLGMRCAVDQTIGITAAGANVACTTTCGALTPPAGCVAAFDAALADAGDILSCTDATADGCSCASPGFGFGSCALALGSGDALYHPAGNIFSLFFPSGVVLGYTPIVTQTLPPDMDADSLDIGGDQTDNDGAEYFAGGAYGTSGRPFFVGDDPAFQFCIDVAFANALTGTDDFHMGFREFEGIDNTFDDYTDLASIGLITGGATGDITIETITAGAATTTTDTTDNMANATRYILCTKVSDTGVVTYTVNGQAPTTTAAYTFTDGLAVIPFVHFLQAAGLTGEIDLRLWEVKYQ
jgi:hypothetical protein